MQDVCTGSMPAVVVAVSKTTIEPFPVHGNPLEWLDCRLARGRMIRIGTVHSRLGNLAMKMQLARNKSILGPGIFGVSPRSIFFLAEKAFIESVGKVLRANLIPNLNYVTAPFPMDLNISKFSTPYYNGYRLKPLRICEEPKKHGMKC